MYIITLLFLRASVGFCFSTYGRYSQVIADYPLAVLVGCAALLLGFSLAGLFIGPLPDFSDPLLVSHRGSGTYTHTHTRATQCKNRHHVYIYSYPSLKARMLFRQSVNYCYLNDSSVIQCTMLA